jgi:hypothetical protein
MMIAADTQPRVWLSGSLTRYFPSSPAEDRSEIDLDAARGERVSFQVVVRTGDAALEIGVTVDAPKGVTAQVRRVGFVPLKHHNTDTPADELDGTPGLVPDPLFPETSYEAGPFETNSFWVTLRVAKDASPGSVAVPIHVRLGGEKAERAARLIVHKAVLPERKDFPVTHWFYADALCDFYKLAPFEEAFWPVFRAYVRDVVEHGQDMLYVPVFTPPTDGVKRPTQLLRVSRKDGRYVFDWTDVRRWVRTARECGIQRFEWCHLFTQWGCKHAIRVYEHPQAEEKLLWPADTPATSDTYRAFLTAFLPELRRFIQEEHIEDRSLFHISDEPGGEEATANYRKARQMMREPAPWMKFMDALSEIHFAKEGLVDTPIPILNTAPEFIKEGFPAWTYFCGGPRGRYLNRLLDTPLPKIRMSGWLFYRLGAHGFLHWGYNYWYKSQTRQMIDPFTEQAGAVWPGWPYGDPFVVYPGPDGPIDSIRWEVFADSLQDLALLQAAAQRDDPMLAEIKDYADFPKSAVWIARRRAELLKRLDVRAER